VFNHPLGEFPQGGEIPYPEPPVTYPISWHLGFQKVVSVICQSPHAIVSLCPSLRNPDEETDVRTATGSLIPLPLAAQRLTATWGTAYRLLLSGQLRGQQEAGRWMVEAASIEEYERRRQGDNHPS
jgi:hypothetical protein